MAGDPEFGGETIDALDADNVAEGTNKFKHVNNAIAEIYRCVKASFGVDHDKKTGKHKKEWFHETVQLTAASATTAVIIIPNTDVTDDRKVYVVGFLVYNSGVAWSGNGFTHITIEDNSNVSFVRIKDEGLAASDIMTIAGNINAVDDGTLSETSELNYTNTDPILKGEGGTANKGIRVVGNAIPANVGTLYITVWGFIY